MDLHIDEIKAKLKNRTPGVLDLIGEYSVLLPLIHIDNQWNIIFEMRSMNLNTQPGEISFPGGKVEDGESFKEAAIRETMEELMIERENIKVFGELDYLVSPSNISIHCFVGVISGVNIDKICPNIEEVDHIFTVPLKYFLTTEPKIYSLNLETQFNNEFPYNLIPKGVDYDFRLVVNKVCFYEYNDYIIWGYTAKMIKNFIEILKDLIS